MSLKNFQLGIRKDEPFAAAVLKMDLDTGVRAMSLAIKHNSFTKFSV